MASRWAATGMFLWCVAFGALSAAAASVTVRDIRFWTGPDHTRVVLDMSRGANYSVRAITGPHRIVIEIPSSAAAKDLGGATVGDGVIDRIRVNRLSGRVQIVLDVPRETKYKHFMLKAAAGKADRIVVDLVRTLSDTEIERREAERKRVTESAGYVIAIDPGHGGDVPGAVSRSGIQEKALNLKLARMLKKEIERKGSYVGVLTRDGDYDVLWYKRILKAREHGADVFVSLHFNGQADAGVRGIELYMISPEGVMDENAEAVAEREHLMQEVQEQGAVVNGDLESILFDVSRSNAMQRSALLTEEVARTMQKDPPIPFRTVRQRNFIVLRGISMPSILVEGGYLSNRKDAAVVATDSYLQWLARSLADGIVSFLEKHPPTQESASSQ